jgi:hypothetical protein
MVADFVGHYLIQGNTVVETGSAWMRRCGEKGLVCPVTTVDAGMGEPAKYCKLISVRSDLLQVGRERIILSDCLRKKELGDKTEVLADGNHALRRGLCSRRPKRLE